MVRKFCSEIVVIAYRVTKVAAKSSIPIDVLLERCDGPISYGVWVIFQTFVWRKGDFEIAVTRTPVDCHGWILFLEDTSENTLIWRVQLVRDVCQKIKFGRKKIQVYFCLQNIQLKYLVLGWKTAALPHRFLHRRDIQSLAKRCSYPSDPSPMWRWGAKDWYHHGCLTLQDHLPLRSLEGCPLLLHSPNAARSPWLRSRGDLFGSLHFGLFDLSPNILDNRVRIK